MNETIKNRTNKPNTNDVGAGLVSAPKGITLIALVITIIILIILAGVTINLALGENGLFNTAKQAGESYEEAGAKEKLEAVLIELQADKITKQEYNEKEYINIKIQDNKMIVNGDVVFVDGWQFQIDRTVPKIVSSLGKESKEPNIQIKMTDVTTDDYVKANIEAEIIYEKVIKEIILNGKNIEVPTKKDGKYTIKQEILENGIYSIIAKDEEGKYNIASVTITDITEDMNIYTVEDLGIFRDRVNSGRTYEGRKVEVKKDIDINEGKYTINNDGNITFSNDAVQWMPIGDATHQFLGNFNGNYHTIKGLYINNNLYEYVGFFGKITNSTIIENIVLDNIQINNTYAERIHYTGGITGYNEGTIQNCAIKKGNIVSDSSMNAVYNEVGGIAGFSGTNSTIQNCYNKALIIGKTKILTADAGGSNAYVGGIVGRCDANGVKIVNCYNIGSINAVGTQANAGGIIGATAKTSTKKQTLENLYNIGNTSSLGAHVTKAGIVGLNGWGDGYEASQIVNSYCTNDYSYYYIVTGNKSGVVSENIIQGYAKTLGEEYTDDIPNTNGTWKYNNGYPILKWQITK